MNLKVIKIISIYALLSTTMAATAVLLSNNTSQQDIKPNYGLVNPSDPYTLYAENLSTSNKKLITDNGNEISFAVYKYSDNTFLTNGYIYNTTPLSGLKSITINCVGSGSNLLIDYGWTTKFESQGNAFGSKNITFDFCGEEPSYFKIRCTYGPTEISSITLTYSCAETPKPDIYDFSYMPSPNDGGYWIIGYTGTDVDVIIPNYYHGAYITGISGTFRNNTAIRTVTLPSTVAYIGNYTFYQCSNLTDVIIPWGSNLSSIGSYAFLWCTSLTSLTLPDNEISLGDSVFYNCTSLESIHLSYLITNIPESTFGNCGALTSLEIPSSVSSIGEGVLTGCISLESLTLPFIGSSLTENQYLSYLFGGSSYSDNETYVPATLKTLTLLDTCTSIPERALWHCPMEEVHLPEYYFKSIGDYAFLGCTSLKSIVVPEGTESIGYQAFYNCSGLKNAYFPSSAQTIGMYALQYCSSIESVSLPFIGGNKNDTTNKTLSFTFGNAGTPSSLKTITLLEGCESLYSGCLGDAKGLETVYFPDSITYVQSGAFSDCWAKYVHVNYSASAYVLSNLDDSYFLSDIYIHVDSEINFFQMTTKLYLFYLDDNEDVHILNSNGDEYTHIDIPSTNVNISNYSFVNCTSLISISIPHSITMIKGTYVFFNCTSLQTITYNGTVEEWNAIEKVDNWNAGAPDIMVTCSNGSVPLLS